MAKLYQNFNINMAEPNAEKYHSFVNSSFIHTTNFDPIKMAFKVRINNISSPFKSLNFPPLQFIALFAFIAVAAAAPQYYEHEPTHVIKSYQPAVVKHVQPLIKKVVEHEEPANYQFEYSVHDDHTGDIKEQHETAKDGAIEGYYTLIDADGYKRIVHYTADDHHGFNAEVRREPIEGHKVVKAAAPVVQKYVAAPVVQKYVAQPQQHYYQQAQPQQHYYQQAQQYYQAPAQVKVVAPVVQKYIAAPVVQKYVAPVVEKVAAPAPKYKAYENDHEFSSQVSFHGPSASYSY